MLAEERTTALDAAITVVNPLLLRELIDQGILARDQAVVLVVALTACSALQSNNFAFKPIHYRIEDA